MPNFFTNKFSRLSGSRFAGAFVLRCPAKRFLVRHKTVWLLKHFSHLGGLTVELRTSFGDPISESFLAESVPEQLSGI
jgi:hypothetical protein